MNVFSGPTGSVIKRIAVEAILSLLLGRKKTKRREAAGIYEWFTVAL